MRHAKPITAPQAPASTARPVVAGDTATGRPGLAGGVPGPGAALSPGPLAAPALASTSTGFAGAASYPGPHQTWAWFGRYLRYPISAVGKLFFSQNGIDHVCSGAVTYGGDSRDVVWTAGHCVSDGAADFDSSALFCPSYNGSAANASVGCWAATSFGTTVEWYNNGDYSRDYGVMFADPAGGKAGTDIANVTGALGFAWNFGRDQLWMVFGYPGTPFSGGKLQVTAAEHRYDVVGGSGPDQVSIGSTQTPGADGGPWVTGFSGQSGFISGNTSYWVTAGANGDETGTEVQGPYFDTRACNDWKFFTGYPGSC